MVQGAKHMKSSNAAANGGSSPQPKPQPKPKRRRKRLPRWADRLITIVIILIGVGLMTWPWILDRLEASGVFNQISTVSSTVDALSAEERERILLQARSFNEQLAGEATELPADQIEPYTQQLIFDRDPMMSWVDIPSIDVSMPIYHGTSEEVLMAGVGHLEGTSLPVGGTSTHCVLTAHSGMRNLSMFDDIHSLEPGDLVLLHTMNKTLAYKMVDSEVVLPEEMESLTIEPGADKVTLVTCTPYGVNDHRLLVHCVRTKYNKKDVDKQKSLARTAAMETGAFVVVGVSKPFQPPLSLRFRCIWVKHLLQAALPCILERFICYAEGSAYGTQRERRARHRRVRKDRTDR